jgi:TonB family protein
MLSVSSLSRFRCILAFFCACSFAIPAHAQSTEAELKLRLMDKPLYLRGFWGDDTLHFDPTGHLLGTSDPISFTLSGFDLKNIQFQQNRLILEGQRVGLELADNKQKRVPLQIGKPRHLKDEAMNIEVDASPSGDYGPALDAIFVEGLADLVPSLPLYWKTYAQKNFLPATTASAPPVVTETSSQEPKPRHIGGGVTPPKVLRSAVPEFNSAARALKYSGRSLIFLYIEPDGTVSHLSVARPLGLGLDERALAAVQQYNFSPATMNGTPVMVELNIEMNFQIY